MTDGRGAALTMVRVVTLAVVGALLLAGCSGRRMHEMAVKDSPAPASASGDLGEVCRRASVALGAYVNADEGLRRGVLTDADWVTEVAQATWVLELLAASTSTAGVDELLEAARGIPEAPQARVAALDVVEPASRILSDACLRNGTEIVLTSRYEG